MRYRGRVENGVVVFGGAPPLSDGVEVLVEPVSDNGRTPLPGSPEALRRCTARWAGDASELDRLLDEVQALRDADLTNDSAES